MRMYVFVFLLCALVAVGQSAKVDGPCPIKITQIQTFDHQRYLGGWYDVYTGSNSYVRDCGSDSGCQATYYRAYDDDTHSFYLNYYFGSDYTGLCSFPIYTTDTDVDARLFYDTDFTSLYILDTDYDSYAVEVGCSNDDGLTHEERVFIRSRNTTISDELRDQLVEKVVDFGFAEPDLIAHNFTGCPDWHPGFWHKD
ncbi:uncharacterized protein LOC107368158 [Tetranychus urticae]|uniref:uncharacterized protein LOC107368158 n=1 Tax=Tetranychus urticae TaxID=32264 RepID=UPI00077C03F9|nr:uncharacterized protein LOC107368158 [Tetranychus urticae]